MPRLIVNADVVDLPAARDAPLLDFLREEAGLTAAKPACRGGDCGACLVLLGEIPPGGSEAVYRSVNSCLLATGRVAGCHVISPEGLAGDTPTPVQQALIDHGGIQCGYCTPGLVIALTGALLNGEPLLEAAGGNLCRCTGYAGIRRACAALEAALPRRRRSLSEAARLGLLTPAVAKAGLQLTALPEEALHGPGRLRIAAGDTDWSVQHAHQALGATPCLDLHRIPALRRIECDERFLDIGAAVTVAELRDSPPAIEDWPGWREVLGRFASPSIRHSATVGGNLVNASPVADLAVILLVLDAELAIDAPSGVRRMPLSAFYQGYHRTGLVPGELLLSVRVPRNAGGARQLHAEKVAKRSGDDIASVNSAMLIDASGPRSGRFSGVRLSAGGVGPYPLRLAHAAAALEGQPTTPATLCRAMAAVDCDIAPIDDIRGSAVYKAALLKHLLVAHVTALCPGFPWRECLP